LFQNALFEEISDLHIKNTAKIISTKLRNLKAAFDERHSKKTVQDYKAFVQRMPQLNKERDSLTNHSELCSKVISVLNEPIIEIEHNALTMTAEASMEAIFNGEVELTFEEAIRVFAIASWRNGGFSAKVFETYKNEIINIYGHDKLRYIY
jgi:hypothetical protein